MTPEQIKQLRYDHKLKQREMAELIHINLRSYQRYESGARQISLGLAELLEIKLKRL